jgi:hypothetical protein
MSMNASLASPVVTILAHPDPSVMLAIFTDASDIATRAALQQRVLGAWKHRVSLSYKFITTQT